MSKCPICKSDLIEPAASTGGDATRFDCPRCGSFVLTGPLIASLDHLLSTDRLATAKLSHVLRTAHERGDRVVLTSTMAEAIIRQPLPRPREQADLLLRWLAENVAAPGELKPISFRNHSSIIGAHSHQGFQLVLDHLFGVGLLTGAQSKTIGESSAHATPSFAGWDHYETLRLGGAVYRRAFMAMKFGDVALDNILETVFKPCVRQTGFDLIKLSDAPRAGLIDDRLRVEIQASDFMIADLTHENLGAYWEAGYAEGLRKPVIYTCEASKFQATKTHFDTNHHLTIQWDASDPRKAGEALKATIRATLPHLARQTDDVI
jgi:hypothetical protein